MTISKGDLLPDATLVRFANGEFETALLSDICRSSKVVLFGLPGAFTRTCSASHLPSFIRTADAFRSKGVDRIICLSVNDPFVMAAWAKDQKSDAAGVELWADAASEFTKSAGLAFTSKQAGFIDRCLRFSAFVENGEITEMLMETKSGVCDLTAGETLLALI